MSTKKNLIPLNQPLLSKRAEFKKKSVWKTEKMKELKSLKEQESVE